MGIEKKVETWVKEKILTQEQGEKILAFEHSESKGRIPQMILYGFLMLGICVVAIGMISLIAANWYAISASVKLISMFLFLSMLAIGSYQANIREKNISFEVLQTGLALSCFGGIGLISQIFHTGGELYQALIFWLLITAPLAFIAKRMTLPGIWTAIFITYLFTWMFNDHSIWGGRFTHHSDLGFIVLIVAICYIITFLTGLTTRSKFNFIATALEWWLRTLMVTVLIVGDLSLSLTGAHIENSKSLSFIGSLLPFAILGLIINKKIVSKEKITAGFFLILSALIFLALAIIEKHSYEKHHILGAGFFVIAASMLALYHANGGRYRLFHTITIMVGIRFLIVYFQVFGNLAQTGLGLIFSGIVIIGIAWGWFKLRGKIEELVKGALT